MGEKGSSWLPDAMSTVAGEVDALFYFTLYTSTIIFVAVVAAMIYFGIRFRRRKESEVPIPVHEPRWLEMTWIVIPTILVMIVFVVVTVLSQVLGKFREAQKQGQQPAQPGDAPKRPKPLENEIRQFLRGALERPGGRGAKGPAKPARPAQAAVEAEVVAAEPVGLRERLEARQPRTLDSSLGQDVAAQADSKMASRVQSVFDHKLGTLEGRPGGAASQPAVTEAQSPQDQITPLPSTAAAGLAAMFSNAQNIRQAVLIQEILQRPEHRWS